MKVEMSQYDKLFSYIDYFSAAGKEEGSWVLKPGEFPYVNYSELLSSFIKDLHETDLMDSEYLSYLKENLPAQAKLADAIDSADFRMLRAILTYFVRQERFQEGLWQSAVMDKSFYRILLRLREITSTGSLK
ncbi:MAG: DUF6508 domain-containing protein [Candidatus Cloacimonetes bacterium]|jgi:hypothetical protein|nr:DUF6508 domain-containing protein [Candidatus Cloacimonadota bacterium]MDY0171488.1 DUF6508 domain-containing protein [Candidatus Cloacimonadaceae bacterium]